MYWGFLRLGGSLPDLWTWLSLFGGKIVDLMNSGETYPHVLNSLRPLGCAGEGKDWVLLIILIRVNEQIPNPCALLLSNTRPGWLFTGRKLVLGPVSLL